MKRNITINQTCNCNGDNCTQIGIIRNDEVYVMQTSSPKREGPAEFTCSMPEQKHWEYKWECIYKEPHEDKSSDTLLQEVVSRVRNIPKLFYDWAENFCWKARKNGYLQ